MKEDVIKKYVKDIDGLLEELSEVQAIPALRTNENAVIFLFGRIFRFLNFDDITIGHEKNDDVKLDAWAWNEKDMRDTLIEFESRSKNFLIHGHDTHKCDLIVCWEDNWKDCPTDILELKSFWANAQEKS